MKWTQQQVVCQQELDDGQHWRNITAAGPTPIRRWDNVFSCGRRMRWPALVKRHSANTTLGQCVSAAGVVSSGYETAAKRLITVNLPEAVSTLAKRRRRLASVETASGQRPLVYHPSSTKLTQRRTLNYPGSTGIKVRLWIRPAAQSSAGLSGCHCSVCV